MGYDVGWCCVRASEVGAIHNRERIGIVAYSRKSGRVDFRAEINRMEWGEQALHDTYPSITAWQRECNLFEPKLLRTNNGISNWVDRIEAIGNAVVPQQFYPFFAAIAEIERRTNETDLV